MKEDGMIAAIVCTLIVIVVMTTVSACALGERNRLVCRAAYLEGRYGLESRDAMRFAEIEARAKRLAGKRLTDKEQREVNADGRWLFCKLGETMAAMGHRDGKEVW